MECATHVAWVTVLLECIWRTYECHRISKTPFAVSETSFHPGYVYLGAYILCITVIFLNIKRFQFFKKPALRNFLSFLHAIDGIAALVLSLAYYFKSQTLLLVGVLTITKFFLLHLLSRMVTGQAAFGFSEISLQTTKTFLHHTGSFLFLGDNTTALITGVWRFISMNGHAAMTLRESISEAHYNKIMWTITHARNAILAIVILLCFLFPDIRRGFALSSTGHIAYMIVRLGPVFRIGSMYIDNPEDKKRWGDNTDVRRLQILTSGKYPWFSFEIGLLAFACLYFAYLRLTTYGIMDGGTCQLQ